MLGESKAVQFIVGDEGEGGPCQHRRHCGRLLRDWRRAGKWHRGAGKRKEGGRE